MPPLVLTMAGLPRRPLAARPGALYRRHRRRTCLPPTRSSPSHNPLSVAYKTVTHSHSSPRLLRSSFFLLLRLPCFFISVFSDLRRSACPFSSFLFSLLRPPLFLIAVFSDLRRSASGTWPISSFRALGPYLISSQRSVILGIWPSRRSGHSALYRSRHLASLSSYLGMPPSLLWVIRTLCCG